jgi:hypothetical protein
MKLKTLIPLILMMTSCARPQKESHPSIHLGDSTLVSISNLLISEIDTSILATFRIELNHSSCLDSSMISIIQYWAHDTTGRFTNQEKSNILKLGSRECDSLVLDKTRFNKKRLLKNGTNLKLKERYLLNFSKMIFNDSLDEAYTILGTYFKSYNDPVAHGGWEEIVIFDKSDSKWKVSKRLKVLEY